MFDYEKIKAEDLRYFVGLIATDGNLSADGRHTNIASKDFSFLENLRIQLNITNAIGIKRREKEGEKCYYQIQIGSVNFYHFLTSVGLTSRKSLTLGALGIPSEYFHDFLRGQIDGDGSICRWVNSHNKYEQWNLRIYTASEKYALWLFSAIKSDLRVNGKIYVRKNKENDFYELKYGKMAAKKILQACYYPSCLSLLRKNNLAKRCIESYWGWENSKTLIN